MKWLVTGFLTLVFGVLSFNAFIGNNLSQQKSSNRIIGMLTDLYTALIQAIGTELTGILFALCAVGIVVMAYRDGKTPPKPE
ncbi:MAG: hypothetical protein LBE61_22915 [Burkholderiaceae bacterium]|jgi:hypothetical protein|nr:hypothetical protein [Burkholderiaceae bacterium]